MDPGSAAWRRSNPGRSNVGNVVRGGRTGPDGSELAARTEPNQGDATPLAAIAVVTGASSGIGRHLAMEFARRGFDLPLATEDSGITWPPTNRAPRTVGSEPGGWTCARQPAWPPAVRSVPKRKPLVLHGRETQRFAFASVPAADGFGAQEGVKRCCPPMPSCS